MLYLFNIDLCKVFSFEFCKLTLCRTVYTMTKKEGLPFLDLKPNVSSVYYSLYEESFSDTSTKNNPCKSNRDFYEDKELSVLKIWSV